MGLFPAYVSAIGLGTGRIMYSEEETLRIELDHYISSFDDFHNDNQIRNLILMQKGYYCYQRYRNLSSFVTIPDTIANLREVESITLRVKIEILPKSLCNLTKLRLLVLSGCYNILSIPSEVLAMPNLEIKLSAVISPASEVIVIQIPSRGISPAIFSVLSSGNKRKISQLIIHQEPEESYSYRDGREEVVIPDELCNVEGIRSICLRGNILKVPNWVFKETSLEMFALCGCFKTLPELLGALKELNLLDLSGSYRLLTLPSSIGNLSKLTSLDLSYCYELVSLPENIGNLSKLTSLNLSGCSNLKCFPSSMQNLPNLTKVKLSNCEFESIPSGIEYLKEVKELDLSWCENLESLPSSIGNLSNLTSLDLSFCENLESLPPCFGNLSQLTSFNLHGCSNLDSLPSSIGNLSNLTSLNMSGCSSLQSLPSSFGNLSQLTSLDLYGCNNLESLPESVGNLSKLTSLDLSECWNVDFIPFATPTHFTHPLWLYGCIEIPLNIEWNNFREGIGLIGYSSFVYGLSHYLQSFLAFVEGRKMEGLA